MAATEVGSARIAIFPVMNGFRSKVTKEAQSAGQSGASIFKRMFQGQGEKTGQDLGRGLKTSFNSAAGDLGKGALAKYQAAVQSAAKAYQSALLRQQDAAGKVRVAQTQLNEAVEKFGDGSSQAVAASERLASAQRREEVASKNLATASERLKEAKQDLADVQVEVDPPKTTGFQRAIQVLKNGMQSLDRQRVDNATGSLTRMGAVAGAIGGAVSWGVNKIASAFSGIVQASMEASDSTDKFRKTLEFSNLDTSKIESLVETTQKYADETVYGLTDIRNITAQLASNGVANYDRLAEAAGNLNAVAGGNADTFKTVGMVLTQTAGMGKLTTENWNQLAEAIAGASGPLQEQMRKNGAYTGNFREAMEKGEITAEEFNQALLELGMTDVAKEAAKSTSTFEGAIGNWEAAVEGFGKTILDVMKPQLTGAINFATRKLESFTSWFSTTWKSVSGLIESGNYAKAFEQAFNISPSVSKKLQDTIESLRAGFTRIGDAVRGLADGGQGASGALSLLNGGLSGVAQVLQIIQPLLPAFANLIEMFGKLPSGVQTALVATVGLSTQLSRLSGPISLASKGFSGLVKGAKGLGSGLSGAMGSVKGLSGGLGGLSGLLGGFMGPAGIASAAAGLVGGALMIVADKAEDTKERLEGMTNALTENAAGLQEYLSEAAQTGENMDWGWYQQAQTGIESFSEALETAGISMDLFTRAVEGDATAIQQYENALSEADKAGKITSTTVNEMNIKLAQQTTAYEDARQAALDLIDASTALDGLNSELSQSMSELSTSLQANGATLDTNTEMGKANVAVLQEAADQAKLTAQAYLDNGAATGDMAGAQQQARNAIYEARDSMVAAMVQAGFSQEAAEAYADSLGLIPSDVGTNITQNAPLNKAQVEAYLDALDLTPSEKNTIISVTGADRGQASVEALRTAVERLRDRTITVRTQYVQVGSVNSGMRAEMYARGGLVRAASNFMGSGYVSGAGSSMSDSIPALLSNGEYVMRASAVRSIGVDTLNAMNRGLGVPVRATSGGVSAQGLVDALTQALAKLPVVRTYTSNQEAAIALARPMNRELGRLQTMGA